MLDYSDSYLDSSNDSNSYLVKGLSIDPVIAISDDYCYQGWLFKISITRVIL